MFDTVNLRLTAADVDGVSFVEEVPCHLSDVGEYRQDGQLTVTGYLGGLKVAISNWSVSVKDGSLCKWHLGDNVKSMGRRDVQRAIERLSDELHLPMNLATVTRLDVACNFIVKHPTSVYFSHLGAWGRAKRLPQPDGLYYRKRDEWLCFYDKNREQRAKGEQIPALYRGRNVLRYEQRYLHRLPSVLKVPAVTGSMLYEEGFYITLLKRWRDTYRSICKVNDIQWNFQAMNGRQGLYRMGILSLVERAGGEVEFIAQIAEAQKRGELSAKQACSMRQAVKSAFQEREGLTVKSGAIAELGKKVDEAVMYYR